MVEQHLSQGFPHEWLLHTFHLLGYAMSALAVAAGVIGEMSLALGQITGPFKLATLLAACNALLVAASWRRDRGKSCGACSNTARLLSRAQTALVGSSRVRLVALCCGCFEAAVFIFAARWTPVLAARDEDVSAPTR
jgi:Sugar-tranasporters, 12 TM